MVRKKNKNRVWFRRILGLLGISVMLLFVFFILVFFGAFGHVPTTDEIQAFEQSKACEVYSEDKKLIGKIFYEDRSEVQLEELPEYIIHALVATEDARYYEHEGLDSRSLLRVLVKSIILNRDAGGGSTITQQLAKNMYGRKSWGFLTTPVAKIREMIIARRLEEVYDKNQILLLYLTQVPFGENIFGLESAAQRFFNKEAMNLNIQEAAVLIGMLKANTRFNPRLHPERSVNRRNVVLSQMNQYGYLGQREKDSLIELPLKLDYSNYNTNGPANYFLVHVRSEAEKLIQEYNENHGTDYDLRSDGLMVKTTLNYAAQKAGLEAYAQHLASMQEALRNHYFKWNKKGLSKVVGEQLKKLKLEDRAEEESVQEVFDWKGYYRDTLSVRDSLALDLTLLHAGLFGLDPQSGAIRTWIGGMDFNKYPYDQIYAKRQMASAFKPILYASALEDGVDPCIRLENDSMVLIDGKPWSPTNYDGSYGGTYSMAGALKRSMNIPTVNLYFEVGFEKLVETWKNLGFTAKLRDRPVTALGPADASLYEAAVAYAAFANGGYRVQPYLIESISTSSGEEIYRHKVKTFKRVLLERTVALMNAMLRGVILDGTGKRILNYGFGGYMAGKTGTSQNYADAWFIGYTRKIVMASRVGASTPQIHFSTGMGSGSSLALPLVGITLGKVSYQSVGKSWKQGFDSLPEHLQDEMDCPDYLEDSLLQEWLNQLIDEDSTGDDAEKKANRRKKIREFMKNVFGKESEED